MHRVLLAFALVTASACLTTVDQRWCDSQTPCSAGFVCTSTFHCIPSPAGLRDAGVGGGGGTRDAGLGGGSGGGGGIPMGGGGGAGGGTPLGGGTGGGGGLPCGVNCNGCCDGTRCVQFDQQSVRQCGPAQSMCQSCGFNEACLSNICTFVPVTTDAGVGGACESSLQCGADGLGQCLPDGSGFPDGYCTRDCTISACPGNAVCVPVEGEVGEVAQLCLANCRAPSDCRMGYFCDWQLGIGLCLP